MTDITDALLRRNSRILSMSMYWVMHTKWKSVCFIIDIFLPLWDYLKMQEKQDILLHFLFYPNTGVHWIASLSEIHTCAKSEMKSNNNGPLSVEFLSLLVPIWAKTWKKMLTKLCQTTSILACGLDKDWGHFSLYPERALFTASLLRLKGDREKAEEKSLKIPKCIAEPWKNTTY